MNDPYTWAGWMFLGLALVAVIAAAVLAWTLGSAVTAMFQSMTGGLL